MDKSDFEGSLVLEALAQIGKLDEFYEAIDADDFATAKRLLKKAKIKDDDIETVLKMMRESIAD